MDRRSSMHAAPPLLIQLTAALGLALAGCRTIDTEKSAPAGIDQAAFIGIDTDASGRVSTHEMASYKHREGLAEVDLDNDQRVSLKEWQAARPTASDNAAAFARVDTDGDGYITETEATNYVEAIPTYREAFAKMDQNHDRELIWEEYSAGDPATLEISMFPAPAPLPAQP